MAVSTEDARSHEFANSVPDRDSVFFKFDDAEFARSHRRVCAVALYGGRVLDGFQFFYDDQGPRLPPGRHGGSRTLFTLAAGEVITEVRGSTGHRSFRLGLPHPGRAHTGDQPRPQMLGGHGVGLQPADPVLLPGNPRLWDPGSERGLLRRQRRPFGHWSPGQPGGAGLSLSRRSRPPFLQKRRPGSNASGASRF